MLRDARFLLVLGVAIGLWVPLARLDWFASHEMVSYAVRTVEWSVELRAGALYPRWCPDFYGGYGSPFFVFHGPVVYGLAGLLHATVLDVFWSLKVVMLLASVLAGAGAYALVFGETRDRNAALLGSVTYLAAPYRIGNLYERGDLAEFACLALLPGVLALYRAVAREALPRRAQRLAVAAAVAHATLIMTHTILGLWGTLVVALIVLPSVIRFAVRRAVRRALLLVGAMTCALGLAAVYIVPAMVYRGIVHAPGMVKTVYNPQDNWISLGTLFASTTPEFGRNFLRMGPMLLGAFVVVLLGLAWRPRRAWPALAWMGFAALLVFLVLPQGRPFWAPNRVPFAPFIQFPWRLLGPVALLASVALGIGAAAAGERLSESLKTRIAVVGAGTLLFVVAWPYVSAREMSTDQVPLDAENIRQWMLSTTEADEFLPQQAAVPAKQSPGDLVVSTDGAAVERTSSQGSHHLLALRADRDGANVGLALHAFPGWAVKTDAGPGDAELQTDGQGLLRLHLPTSGPYRLRLWFGVPGAASVGAFLSILSALGLGLVLLHGCGPWPWRLPVKVPVGSDP